MKSVAALLTEAEAILRTQSVDTPRLDAEVLLAHCLGINRAQLYARLSAQASPTDQVAFSQLIKRRARREPLAYITGVREFWSLEFCVTPAVLIPRPETELVVETVLRLLAQATGHRPQATGCLPALRPPHSAFRILDLGTGSGCIAIALAKEWPEAELWAIDISTAALAVAQENASKHGVAERLHFLQGDVFAPLSKNTVPFDLIVSNPPYIARLDLAALQPEVRDWEPHTALSGGEDGLDFYRRLIEESPSYLRSGGGLVMELGAGQSAEVLRLLRAQRNYIESASVRDYAGHERVAVAYRL
jgi:release factor glutamine methyltransferase